MLSVMEAIRLAPKGAVRAHQILQTAASGLVKSNQLGIFTPMAYFLAQKPEVKI
jgi:sterol 24-C-methyltransferase